jgi:hypothetical protein
MCVFNIVLDEKPLPHTLHRYGRSLECRNHDVFAQRSRVYEALTAQFTGHRCLLRVLCHVIAQASFVAKSHAAQFTENWLAANAGVKLRVILQRLRIFESFSAQRTLEPLDTVVNCNVLFVLFEHGELLAANFACVVHNARVNGKVSLQTSLLFELLVTELALEGTYRAVRSNVSENMSTTSKRLITHLANLILCFWINVNQLLNVVVSYLGNAQRD